MKITTSEEKITPFGGFNFCFTLLKDAQILNLIDTHLGSRVKYGAMIYRMDAEQMTESLKHKGVYENTVIVFTSDNGSTDANISFSGLNVPIKSKGSYLANREPWE